jgi:hypothetical protein
MQVTIAPFNAWEILYATVIMMHPVIIRYSRPLAKRRCRDDVATVAARNSLVMESLSRPGVSW